MIQVTIPSVGVPKLLGAVHAPGLDEAVQDIPHRIRQETQDQTEAQGHVTRGYNNLMWDVQAQVQYYQEQAARGEQADLAKLEALKNLMRQMIAKKEDTLRNALQ